MAKGLTGMALARATVDHVLENLDMDRLVGLFDQPDRNFVDE
jgi:hypothetical protein